MDLCETLNRLKCVPFLYETLLLADVHNAVKIHCPQCNAEFRMQLN